MSKEENIKRIEELEKTVTMLIEAILKLEDKYNISIIPDGMYLGIEIESEL